jgi:hypothetical protein
VFDEKKIQILCPNFKRRRSKSPRKLHTYAPQTIHFDGRENPLRSIFPHDFFPRK